MICASPVIQKYKEMQRLSAATSSNTITHNIPRTPWRWASWPNVTCQCIIFYLVLSRNLNPWFWWFRFYHIQSGNFPPSEFGHADFQDNIDTQRQLSQKCHCQWWADQHGLAHYLTSTLYNAVQKCQSCPGLCSTHHGRLSFTSACGQG